MYLVSPIRRVREKAETGFGFGRSPCGDDGSQSTCSSGVVSYQGGQVSSHQQVKQIFWIIVGKDVLGGEDSSFALLT
jgi:hypothetical protein